MCVKKRSELEQGNTSNGQMALPVCHLKQAYWNQHHSCYSQPAKSVQLNGMENFFKQQLSSVCPVVPFWRAVK
jgi:hypothetical protein